MKQELFEKAANLQASISRLKYDISAAEENGLLSRFPNILQFATNEQKERLAKEVLESMKARLAELQKQFDEL